MSNKLSGVYKKEYYKLTSILKDEVASGKERDNAISELYVLFQDAQNNGNDIETIYGEDKISFIDELLAVLPGNQYKNMKKICRRIGMLGLGIVMILFAVALGCNLYYQFMYPSSVIGGGMATTSIQLVSTINPVVISVLGFGVATVLFIVLIRQHMILER